MKDFYIELKAAAKWVASLVEDKRGSVSHKRILALWGMWILDRIYQNPEKYTDSSMIWPIIVFIATAATLTLPEWFSKLKNPTNEGN